VAGFIAMRVLTSFKTDPPRRRPGPRPKIVEAKVVMLQEIAAQIIAYGRITSSQPVMLFSEVQGTLMSGDIPFRPAQSFKEGDLLLKIDDRQALLDINTAKSNMLNALALVLPEIKVDFPEEFEIWQHYFNNCSFDTKLPDLPVATNQKIKLYLSRFDVYKMYFAIRDLEILLDKHYFYASFDGSIVSTDLRVGSNARNGTQLGKIINLENLEAELPVSAEDIQWIDKNKPITLTSSEIAGKWTGTIKRIGKSIDIQTQTVQVFISVNELKDSNLYDGVFVKAIIPGLTIKNAVSIPRKALYGGKFIYLIKDGRLDYREVNIARRETDSIIVTRGIQDGETVVTQVLQGVAPGMLARAKSSEPALSGDQTPPPERDKTRWPGRR
jgi:multidrug efflux pump subunit AcrA (membrane-fusion protein)